MPDMGEMRFTFTDSGRAFANRSSGCLISSKLIGEQIQHIKDLYF